MAVFWDGDDSFASKNNDNGKYDTPLRCSTNLKSFERVVSLYVSINATEGSVL